MRTYIADFVRSNKRDQDTIFISPLTFIGRQDFDPRQVREKPSKEFDLLSIRCDDGYVLLFDTSDSQSASKL